MSDDIYRLEACVENFEEALLAQKRGVHQVELCASLDQDGLTPKVQVIEQCLEGLDIPVKVMIRPLAGSFVSDGRVLRRMISELEKVQIIGVERVVFGVTTPDGHIDIDSFARLRDHSGSMRITFHKAIDTCVDPVVEVGRLIESGGIHSILTSGGRATAMEGATILREMIKVSAGRLEILPAGRITADNVQQVHELIEAKMYHGRRIVGDLS